MKKRPELKEVYLVKSLAPDMMHEQYYLGGHDGEKDYAISFQYEKLAECATPKTPPVATMRRNQENFPDELRAIFNGLWKAGVRPDGFEDRNRETAAIREHLADMRQLVFKAKEII